MKEQNKRSLRRMSRMRREQGFLEKYVVTEKKNKVCTVLQAVQRPKTLCEVVDVHCRLGLGGGEGFTIHSGRLPQSQLPRGSLAPGYGVRGATGPLGA